MILNSGGVKIFPSAIPFFSTLDKSMVMLFMTKAPSATVWFERTDPGVITREEPSFCSKEIT
ncbi:Uncharacterised protein [Chlamydia trachomatis]|nr:Uncharacterised protein [Chlamydia trachomatis]